MILRAGKADRLRERDATLPDGLADDRAGASRSRAQIGERATRRPTPGRPASASAARSPRSSADIRPAQHPVAADVGDEQMARRRDTGRRRPTGCDRCPRSSRRSRPSAHRRRAARRARARSARAPNSIDARREPARVCSTARLPMTTRATPASNMRATCSRVRNPPATWSLQRRRRWRARRSARAARARQRARRRDRRRAPIRRPPAAKSRSASAGVAE